MLIRLRGIEDLPDNISNLISNLVKLKSFYLLTFLNENLKRTNEISGK